MHRTIKFAFKYSKTKIEFLDVLVYKDNNNNLQTNNLQIFYKKPNDHQTYLHANSEHPRSLNGSIAYSLALPIKRICCTKSEFKIHIKTLKYQFIKRGYEKTVVENQINKAKH